ncbi:DUF3299 domain-containing protein [Schleiferia thermophila]|uniref:DUF3299 domain-containing protein n=2 Tax=Schleiferia thermophila TaxID=884107 RepID=A0A369A7M0_9FLAO|nr:DUF3299 domain-containing protein [Schleiferia thermophila]KFD39942.1 hypothetical protein AT05_00610 [Schleiferia thermophila str. Yellowstone]RCX05360.1 hypothetical protein DES35_101645 [Schleiferia thermophila]GCD79133.1 hypothetical protein JCM30197_03800 [Schleiferia thermophila]
MAKMSSAKAIALVLGLSIAQLWAISVQGQENQGPIKITWKTLQDVQFKERYYKEAEAWFLFPTFGKSLKNLDGKQVEIKGYVIPIDAEGGLYALSAFPFSACYFCGGAGPESVMSLKLKKGHRRYKTDDVVTFRGIFKLNDTDINDFNYILRNAEEVRN